MKTKQPVNNCFTCGQFSSNEETYPYCKKCFDLLCLNCWEPHMIPSNLHHKIPHFCDEDCEMEFTAILEITNLVSKLTPSIDKIKNVNLQMYGDGSYIYKGRLFSFEYDSELEETILQLKIKHNPMDGYKFNGLLLRRSETVSRVTRELKLAELEMAYKGLKDHLLLDRK